jgi:HAE1 family hydrophobic/amphiphilic exporter-1
MPSGMLPPSYQKVNPSDRPILFYALTSPTMQLTQLNDVRRVVPRPADLDGQGRGAVQVFGAQKICGPHPARPERAPGTRPRDRRSGGGGVVGQREPADRHPVGPQRTTTVQASGELQNASDFGNLVVRVAGGPSVRVRDLGQVLDHVQNDKVATWYSGKQRSIMLAIQRQPGSQHRSGRRRRARADRAARAQLPASVTVHKMIDRSEPIRHSVQDVQFTLVLTLVLVVLVIFAFLKNVRATAIPSLALPLSVIGTFAVMKQLGYSLDNLSLMALTLSVGFVVDDAIVMLENIHRHMEMGKRPAGALDGSKEIGFTILSMTVSLVAVFIPVLFMGGLLGRLFHEFAVSISVAILVSGVVSLTLTPMLCSRFLKHEHDQRHGASTTRSRTGTRSRSASTRARWVGHAPQAHGDGVLGADPGRHGGAVPVRPKGFIPSEDTGTISGNTEAAEGTSFDAMVIKQQQAAKILADHPDVLDFMSTWRAVRCVVDQPGTVLRPAQAAQRAQALGRPGDRAICSPSSPRSRVCACSSTTRRINVGGRQSKSQYQFTLQGTDLDELYDASNAMLARIRTLPSLQDVTTDLQISNPQVNVKIDRERAASLGVTAQQIEEALYDAYGSRQISTIYTPSDQYWVMLELLPEYQRDMSALSRLSVRSPRAGWCRSARWHRWNRGSAAVGQPLGPDSVGHAVVQSRARRFARRRGDQVERAARETLPSTLSTDVLGHGAGVPVEPAGSAVAAAAGGAGDLPGARRAVRELIHPLTILSGFRSRASARC